VLVCDWARLFDLQSSAAMDGEYVHNGVMCDGCGHCVLGVRYCLGVQDFCGLCITRNEIENNNPGMVTKIMPPKRAVKPTYPPAVENNRPWCLLIIDAPGTDWQEVFAGGSKCAVLPSGCEVEVVQCGWEDLSLTAYCDEGETKAICNGGTPVVCNTDACSLQDTTTPLCILCALCVLCVHAV